MSLLADLLSKVKHQGLKRDVPPNLKYAVLSSYEKYAAKKRIIFLSSLVLVAAVAGVGAVYLISFYGKPYEAKKPVRQAEKPLGPVVKKIPPPSEVILPGAITPKLPKEQASGADIQKKKGKKEIAVKLVKRHQKTSPKEEVFLSPEAKIPELSKGAGDKKMLSGENLSKRDTHILTAQTYESKKDYHKALASYKKALAIDPENHVILNNIAGILIRSGSYNEAIQHLKNALSIKEDYVPSLINLGIAHAMLSNFSQGENYLAKALSTEPSNTYALLNFGILYERCGNNDKAYGFFYKLSQTGNIQGYLGIARLAEKQGRFKDAAKIYHEIMSMNGIDPENKKFANERLSQLGR